ncbi:IclR family transcriptional regulator [Sediminicoccus rosea]|uniref:IclR family transcriptional regulator n=1 Tax=Sediminicoccus rosea TaxID=1225128 RepID=A0ABZ0PGA8_9PROT|nr:IclR family transcriptional regulator [Sediminicoccus rosea]WPB84647.1 IclR family transcriptional regulator [Sediminicoccus rosea]
MDGGFAPGEQRGGPRSVARVLELMGRLASAPEGLTLAALAGALDAPKTSLLGLLRGLAAEGYAVQQEARWRLGPEAVGLARAILAAAGDGELVSTARPVLERLAEQMGETAMLAVLAPDRRAMVYADKVESRTALRFAATVGDARPIHCTASGRVMLAFLPPPWPAEFLRGARLPAYSPTSVTDRRALRRIVAETRAQGFAVTLGETTEGVAGIAAPVFGARGEVVAALMLAGPIARVEPRIPLLSRRVCEAAGQISRRLGHRPN